MKKYLVLCLLLLFPFTVRADTVDVDSGASGSFVDVVSSTAGIRIGPDALKTAIRVRVKADAVVQVCFNYVDRGANCATALTNPDNAGYCASAGEAYIYLVEDEHFRGQVCAILASGSTSVRVPYNAW